MNSFTRASGHRATKELILHPNLPTRRLTARPDLEQLRHQAKELLTAYRAAHPGAIAEINVHFRHADPANFALHDAQLVLARSYGFESWPKLKARVDGATVSRLVEAVRAGDQTRAQEILKARPELAAMSMDGLPVLHHAVLARRPDIVRLLIEHGASPSEGVYPHRDSTSALDVAIEREYHDIAAVIRESESKLSVTPAPGAGVDPSTLDAVADAGAPMTAQKAAAVGDTEWLRTYHPENPIEPTGGLLRIAVMHNRPEVLRLLLDLGYDPDERLRIGGTDEIEFSWGMPLWHCAGSGKYGMAELLLQRGADPNGRVYASGSPLFQAFSQRDAKMIDLLRQYGGEPEATAAGLFCQTELARQMLAGEAAYKLDGVGGDTLPEQLLWGAACGGDPSIVRMALERVDWRREDPRWITILEQPLRIWRYGVPHEPWDRGTYLTCFKLVLDRADPNISGRFGLTMLHNVAGSRQHVTAEERIAFATMLLDAGAKLDVRDGLLDKTPMEWARRRQRPELVQLFSR
jgi:ankyrin repeat protein